MTKTEAFADVPAQQHRPRFWQRARNLAWRALIMEVRIYASVWRWITRRPAVPSDALGFHAYRPILTVLIIFIVLSAIEIPILDLIVHRWLPVRIPVLIVGIWGLTWMLGLLAAYLTRLHTVGPEGMQVREGLELSFTLPWTDIASVGIVHARDSRISGEPKPPRVWTENENRFLALRMNGETNIEVRLKQRVTIKLPGLAPRGGTQDCNVVRFWVDDPDSLLDAVRTHIA